MLLTIGLVLFLVITSNSQGFPNYGEANFPPAPKFPFLPNFEILQNFPATAIDKTLDTLLEKTHQLDEYTFLFAIQGKILVDMTRKCDCEALYYIEERLNDYLNYNVPRTGGEADEPVLENDEQPQKNSDIEENNDNTLEEKAPQS